MNDMTANLDLSNMSLEDLDNLSVADLLGEDISKISLSQNLPDGVFAMTIEKYELKSFAAKPEENKKARRTLNLTMNVIAAIALTDGTIDPASLIGRKHFESYDLLSDFGRSNIVKLLLGILGVKFTDKAAIAQVGQAPAALLETIKAEKIPFGAQIKTVERGGYENCNIVLKEKDFISAEKITELLD